MTAGTDVPPVQLTEQQLASLSPEQANAAFEAAQLHTLMGGEVDAEGWPLDQTGKRIVVKAPRTS